MIKPFFHYGTVEMQTESERLQDRAREPQSLTLTMQSADKNAYRPGTCLPAYPGMPIVERERTQDGPVWQFRLLLEGIEDPKQLYIETGWQASSPEEGWDEIQRVVFTREPQHAWFAKGAQIYNELTGLVADGFKFLWIMDRVAVRHRAFGYWEVSMVLKGLLADKPFKRRYNGTPQTISPGPATGLVTGSYSVWIGFPPVSGGTASFSQTNPTIEYDIPQISITDTFVTSTPPPTDYFPGFWAPEDPPPVFYLPVTAVSYTYHIPFGWKILNLVAEKLAGQDLWILSLTFGIQAFQTPKN